MQDAILKLEGWHRLWEMGFHPDFAPLVLNKMSQKEVLSFQYSFRGEFRLISDGLVGPWTIHAWNEAIYNNTDLCRKYLQKYCAETPPLTRSPYPM